MSDFSFSQIPGLVLTPGTYIEFDTSRMLSGLPQPRTRVLIAGQKLAAGTATANTLYRIFGLVMAKTLFGQGSMLANMVESYLANDTTTEVWAIGLDDNGAGVRATGTLVFTGPATATGLIDLEVLDKRVQVPVASGASAATVATAIAAAITAQPDLPISASVAAGTVTLSARHRGLESNGLAVRQVSPPPAGIGLVITQIGSVAAGTLNPDATAVFTAIGDEPFATLIHPWTDAANLTVIENACRDRADAMTMNYSQAYTFKSDTYGNLTTLASGRNSEFSCIGGFKGSMSPQWKIAAAYGAKVTWWSRNALGCPFTDLVLEGILPPAISDRFIRDERELLLESGLSTFKTSANGDVVIERMVTTRKTNAQGFADAGLRRLTAMLLMYYLSWSQQARIAARFSRYKLGDDGNYGPGARVATPRMVRSELIALAQDWFEAGLIENLDQYITDLQVVRDETDPDRLNSLQRPDLINEFNVLATLVQPYA